MQAESNSNKKALCNKAKNVSYMIQPKKKS